jgi:hypothetical protein
VASTSGTAVSADAGRLQTELLQLSVLRDASWDVQRAWEASAKRSLQHKFRELAAMHADLSAQEQEVQEQVNLRALQEWTHGTQSVGLAEQMQLLGSILQELPSLSEIGGRYGRLLTGFDEWAGLVQGIWEARDGGIQGTDSNASGGVAEGLGEEWKAETAALTRKIHGLSREAGQLADAQSGSTVDGLVRCCRALLGGMLEELQLMQAIEREVAGREREWVEAGLERLSQDLAGVQRPLHDDDGELWWRGL